MQGGALGGSRASPASLAQTPNSVQGEPRRALQPKRQVFRIKGTGLPSPCREKGGTGQSARSALPSPRLLHPEPGERRGLGSHSREPSSLCGLLGIPD